MKIVAFNGSPRKGGNTEQLIEEVFSRSGRPESKRNWCNWAENCCGAVLRVIPVLKLKTDSVPLRPTG